LLVNPGIVHLQPRSLPTGHIRARAGTLTRQGPGKLFQQAGKRNMREVSAVRSILSKMTRLGARVAMMSGSGSTCFACLMTITLGILPRGVFRGQILDIRYKNDNEDEYQQCFPSLN
jgi:hypothetical protein